MNSLGKLRGGDLGVRSVRPMTEGKRRRGGMCGFLRVCCLVSCCHAACASPQAARCGVGRCTDLRGTFGGPLVFLAFILTVNT